MRKTLASLTAVGAFVAYAAAASAQSNSVLWFDVRDGSAGAQSITTPVFPFTNGQDIGQSAFNSGGAGDGQVLRITPVHGDNTHLTGMGLPDPYPNFDADGNTATANLQLYMTVNDDLSGTGDVISSIGVDFNLTNAGAGGGNPLGSLSWEWDATNWQGTNAGINNGASDGGNPPSWLGAKAVKVPVNASAQYDTTGGLVPAATPYHLGALQVTGGQRNCSFTSGSPTHAANSTFNVNMSVNDLLITRVFQSGGDASETVSFGYANGVPEAGVNGSQVGAGATGAPDAVIQVVSKSDASLDGRVLNNDLQGFLNARTASTGAKQMEIFLHDYTNDRRVLNNDLQGFLNSRAASTSCP